MKSVRYSLVALLLLITGYAFAQYPTNGNPTSWASIDGYTPHEVGDYICYFYKDAISDELCAYIETYIGPSKKNIKIPRQIKYEGKSYVVRDVNFVAKKSLGIEHVTMPSTLRILSGFSGAKSLGFEKNCELITIKDGAFYGNNDIESIFLGAQNNLDSIGEGAFRDCKSLKFIILPRYIKHIKEFAFSGCERLSSIMWSEDLYPNSQIPLSVMTSTWSHIERSTFAGCTSLREIVFPFLDDTTIGEGAFSGCQNLEKVFFEHYVSLRIEKQAFLLCSNLKTIKCKDSTTETMHIMGSKVGEAAFQGCKSITDVNLTVDTICRNAFDGCSSLKKVAITGTKYIGRSAFLTCDKLESVCCLNDDTYFEDRPSLTFANSMSLHGLFEIEYSYKNFANRKIKNEIRKWRIKKEYETTAQWIERVTAENQNKKIIQLLDSARSEYISNRMPKPNLKCAIESYDADGGVFKLKVENINTYLKKSSIGNDFFPMSMGDPVYVFAKVPASDAPAFKENFDKVKIAPTYCIAKNYLGIATCKFTLNGITYDSPTLYDDETANVQIDLPPLEIDLGGGKKNDMAQVQIPIDNALDKNIPSVNVVNKNCFAVIIGNENYSQVAKVSYAENDAKVFAEYCRKTLGMPKENVRTYGNATYAGFVQAMKDIKDIAKAYNGNLSVVFYYAGHGIPNEQSKDAYLLPVDADGKQMDVCYSVGKLYKELGSLGAKNVTVFMDACFSGAQRGEGMLASARGVALKAKAEAPQGNMVVFSAATGDETAYPYKEKGHGMFTYFLLKKLQESKGDCTLQELGEYIQTNVKQQSVVINRKSQTPTVIPSQALVNSWKTMKLK